MDCVGHSSLSPLPSLPTAYNLSLRILTRPRFKAETTTTLTAPYILHLIPPPKFPYIKAANVRWLCSGRFHSLQSSYPHHTQRPGEDRRVDENAGDINAWEI